MQKKTLVSVKIISQLIDSMTPFYQLISCGIYQVKMWPLNRGNFPVFCLTASLLEPETKSG